MKLSKRFENAAKYISQPGKWCRDRFEDEDGARCMLGAVAGKDLPAGRADEKGIWQMPSLPDGLQEELDDALHDEDWPPTFNDASDTTQEDAVMACLHLAEYLKGEGR